MEQPRRTARKALYEIVTSAGKLHVEVNAFANYLFLVVAYASLLRLDGSLQLAQSTPYVHRQKARATSPSSSVSSPRTPPPATPSPANSQRS
jgi:hypothetical protein